MSSPSTQNSQADWIAPFGQSVRASFEKISKKYLDKATNEQLERGLLGFLQQSNQQSAHELRDLTQALAAGSIEDIGRSFWGISSSFFELFTMSTKSSMVDITAKRKAAQMLSISGVFLRGGVNEWGSNCEPFLQDLLLFCLRKNKEIRIKAIWPYSMSTPCLEAVLHASAAADSFITTQSLEDFRPDRPVKFVGDLRIPLVEFNAYLNDADEWSRHLLTELNEWSLELNLPMQASTVSWVDELVKSSKRIGFEGLTILSSALVKTLRHVQPVQPMDPHWVQLFIHTAEELRRLLHQFAAGFLKSPEPSLIHALQALMNSMPAPAYRPGSVARFSALALKILDPLSSVLHQWSARTDNSSAQAEVSRLLENLILLAQQYEHHAWVKPAQTMQVILSSMSQGLLEESQGLNLISELATLRKSLASLEIPKAS